jgi:hypothetical protein
VFERDGRSEEETTPPVPLLRSRYWSWHKLRPDSFIIGFCGKLYPGLRIPTYCTDDYKEVICYSPEEAAKWVEANLKARDITEYRAPVPKRHSWKHKAAATRGAIEEFFAKVLAEQNKHEAVFEKYEAPILMFHNEGSRLVKNASVEVNPCLTLVEFYRILDPYTAYQELAMYLGKQAQPEKQIPDVPDKVMVGAKGFDKWSFRKPPSKRR